MGRPGDFEKLDVYHVSVLCSEITNLSPPQLPPHLNSRKKSENLNVGWTLILKAA